MEYYEYACMRLEDVSTVWLWLEFLGFPLEEDGIRSLGLLPMPNVVKKTVVANAERFPSAFQY